MELEGSWAAEMALTVGAGSQGGLALDDLDRLAAGQREGRDCLGRESA